MKEWLYERETKCAYASILHELRLKVTGNFRMQLVNLFQLSSFLFTFTLSKFLLSITHTQRTLQFFKSLYITLNRQHNRGTIAIYVIPLLQYSSRVFFNLNSFKKYIKQWDTTNSSTLFTIFLFGDTLKNISKNI